MVKVRLSPAMTGQPIGPGGGAKVKGLKSLSGDKKALEAFDA